MSPVRCHHHESLLLCPTPIWWAHVISKENSCFYLLSCLDIEICPPKPALGRSSDSWWWHLTGDILDSTNFLGQISVNRTDSTPSQYTLLYYRKFVTKYWVLYLPKISNNNNNNILFYFILLPSNIFLDFYLKAFCMHFHHFLPRLFFLHCCFLKAVFLPLQECVFKNQKKIPPFPPYITYIYYYNTK
jgi:hypothetical protein